MLIRRKRFILLPKFGNREGQKVMIVRALYGLKSSAAAWHAHISSTLYDLGFTSSLAHPNLWYKTAAKPDGFEYYAYDLIYVDDILAISHSPKETMEQFLNTVL